METQGSYCLFMLVSIFAVPYFIYLFQEDLGVNNSFMVWYIYAMTEAIISYVLIPIGVFLCSR